MTAEIAIINRSAVTLAADSAMTLNVRGREKIYTSADKVFELCNKDSIGIMVYNNLEFLAFPIELAIKQFRESKTNTSFKTVRDAAEAFFQFLVNDLEHTKESLEAHVFNTISVVYAGLVTDFEEEAVAVWQQEFSKKKKKKVNYPGIFLSKIKKYSDHFKSGLIDGPIALIPDQTLKDQYGEVISKAIEARFEKLPIDDDDKALLSDLAISVLRSKYLSQSYSGLVFAGYGSDEVFPSIHAYEIDGVVVDTIKKNLKKELSKYTGAEIIPFAQREMVDRFMFGVDPQFQRSIEVFFKKLLDSTGKEIINLSTSSKRKRVELQEKLTEATDASLEALATDFLPKSRTQFREQIEDMVLFMAKPELASLAEALVNITSVKRKFSADRETVAGPIDVAVISKTDGFVWVKRKHYFTPEFNPRYFWRKYSQT